MKLYRTRTGARLGRFDLLVRWGLRNGVTKGFLGGHRRWLVMGGVALGFRVLRKMAGAQEEIVYSTKVDPGQTIVIANGRVPK